jgi:predicted small lipoprotein YifL
MKPRLGFALLLSFAGCGTPGRPVGLPPPEYEQPRVEPWLPASVETSKAGAAGAPSAAGAQAGGNGIEPAPEAPAGLRGNSGGSSATLSPGTP